MHKIFLLAIIAIFIFADLTSLYGASERGKPNIVLILADDLGYGDVRCYNAASKAPTPNMDRLASQGIRFTNAYSPAAVCVTTRYGLLTGRYPFRNDKRPGQHTEITEDRMTIASLLRRHGYTTGCVGKWHLGFEGGKFFDCSKPLRGGPVDRGFEYYYGLHASLDIEPYLYIENDRCVSPLSSKIPASGERDLSSPYQGKFWRAGRIAKGFRHEEVLDRLTEKAVGFLQRHHTSRDRQPFFLYFPLTAPHGPWVPSESFRGNSECGAYGDFLMHTDHVIGKVMETLDSLNYSDDTLVILSSDNGPLWFDPDVRRYDHRASHVFRGRKGDIWEGGVRMPFIARWPGNISPGTASEEVISLTDMLATTAAILAVPLPDDAGEDSHNMLPALLGKELKNPIRDTLIVQSVRSTRVAIRQGDWKLIPWLGGGGFLSGKSIVDPEPGGPVGQLYNLKDDPSEQNNLYQDHPEVVQRLTKLLDQAKKRGRTR